MARRRPAGDKLVDLPRLLDQVERQRRQGRRVVFTNGCFDLLHAGHLQLLEAAAAEGDCLIVAINRDESVRRVKGASRPYVPFRQRAALVAGLAVVDFVVGFEGPTPLEVIELLRPDVLVKGGDWPVEQIIGRELVEKLGGRVLSLPRMPGASTSRIAARIRDGRPDARPGPRGPRRVGRVRAGSREPDA